MGTPTTGTTGLGSPQDDLQNHTRILRQLKETTEVAQRQRGDPNSSFVRLGELLGTLAFKYTNNQLSFGGTGSSSAISAIDSISGAGTVASPLQLVNDTASPGNSKYYGTNASGVKGWYTSSAGGGSLSVTDGTNTVAGTTSLTFSGATVSGSTPNATVTISGGGSTPYPGTLKDLAIWYKADAANVSSGTKVASLADYTPWHVGAGAIFSGSSVTVPVTQLNGLNVWSWGGTNIFVLNQPIPLNLGVTYFIVINGQNPTTNQAICGQPGGGGGGVSLYLTTGSGGNIAIVQPFVAVMATSSATWTAGTWFQANVTYNISTGAWAFRQARAAANSGTYPAFSYSQTVGDFGGDGGTAGLTANVEIAEFIAYNRVLTGTEITNVENYLHTKWGV